jgi:hypothetical protein
VQAGLVLQKKYVRGCAEWSLVNDPHTAFTLFDLTLWLLVGLLGVLLVRGLLRLFKRRGSYKEPSINLKAIASTLRRVGKPIGVQMYTSGLQLGIWLTKFATFMIRATAVGLAAYILWLLAVAAFQYGQSSSVSKPAEEEVVQISPTLIPHSVR